MRRSIAALALALLASGAQADFRIGLSAPLTGPDAGFGQGLRAGAEQAVADINRAGGVNGQKLALVAADDAGDGRQGLAAARRLVAERVTVIVGPINAAVAAAAMPLYEEAGIVAVVPGVTWAPLTARGFWNVFRMGGSDAAQAAAAGADLAERFRGRRIGLVHDRTGFGRGLVDEVARVLRVNGQREAAFESLARGDRELGPLAARLKRTQVEVVYFGGLAAEAGPLIRALREAGVPAPLMGSDGLVDKDFAGLAGPGAEGTLMTLAPEPRRLPEAKLPSTKASRPPEAEAFAAQGYAAVEVLKQAVEQAKSADGRKVAAFLHGGAALRTAVGPIAYDANGDPLHPGYAVVLWRKTADGRIDYAGGEARP